VRSRFDCEERSGAERKGARWQGAGGWAMAATCWVGMWGYERVYRCHLIVACAAAAAGVAGSAMGWRGTLRSGDVLFIPPHTLHYTHMLEEGVAMNHFWSGFRDE
jgi:hypothetical protein